MYKRYFLCLLVVFLVLPLSHAQKNKLRKRVVVFEFQDKSSSKYQWWDSKTVGEGISEMIITELAASGDFRIIEVAEVEESGKEITVDLSDINGAESAAEAGRTLGAEVAIYGVVTEFGQKQDNKSVRISGIRVGGSSQSAVVGMDIRMINTQTGEIIFADNVRESKSTVSPDVSYRSYRFDSRSSFDESLIGKATRKAVEQAAKLIERNAGDIPWSAKVITSDGGKVYINAGQLDGLEKGMSFKVYRLGKALIDPDTGIPLGKIDEEIGELEVDDPAIGQGKASLCKVLSGSNFERGDVIRRE